MMGLMCLQQASLGLATWWCFKVSASSREVEIQYILSAFQDSVCMFANRDVQTQHRRGFPKGMDGEFMNH